jgi:hypothetical protein
MQTLEKWAVDGKADIREDALWVVSSNTRYPLQPAVHVQTLVSGTDEKSLVSKVKTRAQMDALGAEQVMDSVLVGEAAYQVLAGYLADVPLADYVHKTDGEAELLAAFLLGKLSP